MGKSLKGGEFEREISKQLSLWWTEDLRDDIFWRTSQSGGRATQRQKSGKSTAGSYGDLTFIDDDGKPFIDYFLLELKRGYTKDIELLSFVDYKSLSVVFKWLEKAEGEKRYAKRQSVMLIVRRNRKETFVIFPWSDYGKAVRTFGQNKGRVMMLRDAGNTSIHYAVMNFENLLNWWNHIPFRTGEWIDD